jgi:hypothetical protein
MSLVGVPRRRCDAQGSQHPYTPDAEQDLLAQPQLGASAVQLGGQLAITRLITLEVGIQQEHGDTADQHLPRAHRDLATGDADGRDTGVAVRPGDGREGSDRGIELLVGVLLPAIQADALIEIPLGIKETDRDERYAEIGGGLAVISGEHAQPAGVDRHGVVETELRAEVGHRLPGEGGVFRAEPGVGGIQVAGHALHERVVTTQKRGVGRTGREAFGGDALQQLDRVVPGGVPLEGIDGAE